MNCQQKWFTHKTLHCFVIMKLRWWLLSSLLPFIYLISIPYSSLISSFDGICCWFCAYSLRLTRSMNVVQQIKKVSLLHRQKPRTASNALKYESDILITKVDVISIKKLRFICFSSIVSLRCDGKHCLPNSCKH